MKCLSYMSVAAVIAVVISGPAFAQKVQADSQTGNDQPDSPLGIEDIVVTAQRTAGGDKAQKVAVAVTALNSTALARAGAVTFEDVGRLAPNVALQPAGTRAGHANFTIRGIGLTGSLQSADPTVNVIIDNLVYEFPIGVPLDTFGVESIEILRGPQGILFGRNSTGGAVSINGAAPTNRFDFSAEARLGNGGRKDIAATVSGPIISDLITGRLTVIRRTLDGLIIDRNGGTLVPTALNAVLLRPAANGVDASEQGRSAKEDQWIIRPVLSITPTENLTVILVGEHAFMGGHGTGSRLINPTNGLQALFGYTAPTGAFAANQSILGQQSLKSDRFSIEANLNVGAGVITSITGWRNLNVEEKFDVDGTPLVLFSFPEGNETHSRQFTQEVRFASTFSDVVNFVTGGYYSSSSIDARERRLLFLPSVGLANPPIYVRQQLLFHQDAESKALFANVGWNIVPKLKLSLGGRYTEDEKAIDATPLGNCLGLDYSQCSTVRSQAKRKWHNFSPRMALDYQLTSDTLVYASFTKGYRSGNFNSRANSVAGLIQAADPEKVKSYELGFKSMFFDRRARFNLAVFQTDYADIQKTFTPSGQTAQFLINAASAKIKGFEAETTLRPFGGLQIDATVGYLDAKYLAFAPAQAAVLLGQGIANPTSLKFDRLPQWTAYASASYIFNVSNKTTVTPRVSYSWRSATEGDLANTPQLRQGAYGLTDAGLKIARGPVEVEFWGKNLANKDYFDFSANFTFGTTVNGGVPRSYGVTLGYKY